MMGCPAGRRLWRAVLLLVAAVAYPGTGARAQDQELMARIYGTRLPDGHLEFARSQPQMFDFARALRSVGARAAAARAPVPGPVDERGWEAVTAAAPVSGTYRIAAVIGLFAGGPASPVSPERLQREFFSGPNSYYRTVTDYFHEMSGGLLTVTGTVFDTVRSSLTLSEVMGKDGCLTNADCRLGQYIRELLEELDARGVDWGLFDNDGPDGIPNSGDDDGYVDFVAFLYATSCKDDGRSGAIWPHRGAMKPMATSSPAAGGGQIMVSDYVVLSATQPGTCEPLHIGVLAHETGHALGLPDLYDYDGSSQGIGAWGLMGTGSHSERYSPAHLGAWAKEQLGWVRVDRLTAELSKLEIAPVQRSRTVYRYDIPGTGNEYLLLENRQRIGSDKGLPGSGLLIWRVDPDRGELGAWNGDESHPAVGIVEADGRRDLRGGRSADAGDPFPGATFRDDFDLGGDKPLRLTGITERGETITADLAIGFTGPALVASPAEVRLTATASADPVATRVVAVRREGGATGKWRATSTAPWLDASRFGEALALRADASGLAPGLYTDTVVFTLEGVEAPAGRVVVELDVAAAGAPDVVATGLPWGWGLAARAGRLFQASYGWDPLGMRPRPRVLHLPDANRHLQTLARLPAEALYSPVPAPGGGVFVIARAHDTNYLYRVGANGRAALVAKLPGGEPAYGAAVLRDGSVLVADWSGRIQRVLPTGEVEPWTTLSTSVYQIAVDSLATVYAAGYSGDVLRVNGDGRVDVLPTGFGPGRLVAIAASAAGDVYAAERGGAGRILRITRDGTRQEFARLEGAEFYGLAVDGPFLYALDLSGRRLLRFPMTAAPVATSTANGSASPDSPASTSAGNQSPDQTPPTGGEGETDSPSVGGG